MRTFGVRGVRIAISTIVLAGASLFHGAPAAAAADAIEQFLARHWSQPLAPQGEPPEGFAPVEAALAPEKCATCHAAQYADWRTSLHSRSIGPGILWQFRVLKQDEANACLRCHAPLAEQKALMALEQGWSNAPKAPAPPYVSKDLHRQGLICAACHVRRHQRFGPPGKAPAATAARLLPHNGFSAQEAFMDSRFCSTCHQFPRQGRSLAGKLIENTYEEWRVSPAAKKGVSCQNCHMPDRRHLWRGIHDREMVARGLRLELEARRLAGSKISVRAVIAAPGVGHFFPTYVVPKVNISLHLVGSANSREIARQVIGRTVSVDMDRELSDTRIPPGGRSLLTAQTSLASGEGRVELRIEVQPAEHYARMFQSMLERNPKMDAVTASMLRQALREAAGSAFRLNGLVVAVPTRDGESQHAVAN